MEKELKKQIADNLRVLRAKHRLTQDGLAEIAGISSKYLTKIENEKANPSILILYKISKALNITLNDIVY